MKRKIIILALMVICLTLISNKTLAYFTSKAQVHNVITTGNIEIELKEWADDEKTKPFENLANVMPGQKVTKIVEIKNISNADVWVRASINKKIKREKNNDGNTELIEIDINDNDWIKQDDGYYYYKEVLKPNEVTKPLFTKVNISGDMDNDYKNANINIDVIGYAVQSANNGDDVLKAQGWPE